MSLLILLLIVGFTMSIIGLFILVIVLVITGRHSTPSAREVQYREDLNQRMNEVNGRLSRMDEQIRMPTDLSAVMEEVRQLRDDLAKLRQDMGKKPDETAESSQSSGNAG